MPEHTPDYDALVDMYYDMPGPRRGAGVWIIPPVQCAAIQALVDVKGQPLWRPSLETGHPDRLFGRPILLADVTTTTFVDPQVCVAIHTKGDETHEQEDK